MTYKPFVKKDILYPDLSYKIIGAAFDAFNKLGPGYDEKYYQKAFAEILASSGILFKKEVKIVVEH